MRKLIAGLIVAAVAALPASAALKQGAVAPDFFVTGARGGKDFRLHLTEQLRKGPLVLYFFPKAFTQGCTLEAKAFSDAMPQFRKAGAQVVGMSADDLPTLKKFSAEACRNAFPVATATKDVIGKYDVAMGNSGLTNRTSYVIAPNGRIAMVHSEGDWSKHVDMTLAAVRALKRS
ncbi:peroxiredoxin [Sphingomonas piscis]|uniref:thioredoxin-dependent peroxiredoxin n=1 Tax=Sphingomonas piscis TaxID=2714943 RepID=A0A6G7YPE2_9SPHN|nr:peroxiredoxin [Sphingomonas piscis]QIK78610.1 peroxiredoxin [Sphingomonas piscis]